MIFSTKSNLVTPLPRSGYILMYKNFNSFAFYVNYIVFKAHNTVSIILFLYRTLTSYYVLQAKRYRKHERISSLIKMTSKHKTFQHFNVYKQ